MWTDVPGSRCWGGVGEPCFCAYSAADGAVHVSKLDKQMQGIGCVQYGLPVNTI